MQTITPLDTDINLTAARELQVQIAAKVEKTNRWEKLQWIAGLDAGYIPAQQLIRTAVALYSFPDLVLHESHIITQAVTFPYVPGFLSFREVPGLLTVMNQLKQLPDLLLCDGHGYAHPRHCGIACHIGVLLDMPSIGVGKSPLVGRYLEPAPIRGAQTPIHYKNEIIGNVLRTRNKVKPVYISVGHRIDLATACDLVLKCAPQYRLPEPIREADRLASQRHLKRHINSLA